MPKIKDDNHLIKDRIPQSRLAGLTSNLFERPEALQQRNHSVFLFGSSLSRLGYYIDLNKNLVKRAACHRAILGEPTYGSGWPDFQADVMIEYFRMHIEYLWNAARREPQGRAINL